MEQRELLDPRANVLDDYERSAMARQAFPPMTTPSEHA